MYTSILHLTIATLVAAPLAAMPQGNTPPAIDTGEIVFGKQFLDRSMVEAHDVAGADFDGDGRVDVVATDFINGRIVWYRSTGPGSYASRILDAGLAGAYPVSVADLDADGDADVLAGGFLANLFVWYENDGAGNFTRHTVDSMPGPHSIIAGDVDRDGDLDLVTSTQLRRQVAWYENDGAQNFTRHTVDSNANGAKRASMADLDGDGDVDIMSAAFFANQIAWYRNDGNQNFLRLVIDNRANGAYFVTPADVDADGDQDILAAAANDGQVLCYENLGGGNFAKRVIDGDVAGARTVIAGDVDNDGDLDAIATGADEDQVAWYENDGTGTFTRRIIDPVSDGAYGLDLVDVDDDGRLDLLHASRDDNSVSIYTHSNRHWLLRGVGSDSVLDASVLSTSDAEEAPAQILYTLLDAPDRGVLSLSGVGLSAGSTFSQAHVDAGLVRYAHAGSVPELDGFTFSVSDGVNPALRGTFEITLASNDEAMAEIAFDDGVGSLARDVGPLGNDGTLVGGGAFEAASGDGSAFSARLDGVDDRIDLGNLDVTGGSGLTLAAWFRADGFNTPSQDERLISKATGTSDFEHVFMLSTIRGADEPRIRGRIRINGVTTTLVAGAGDIRLGVWHHAAMTYDGATFRLYLDGAEVGSVALSGPLDVDPAVPVVIGAQPPGAGGRYFDGMIDDVRILRRAMHPAEIDIITRGCTGSFVNYGAGLAGSGGIAPRIAGIGCPSIHRRVLISVNQGLGGAAGFLVVGQARTSFPLLGGTLLAVPLLTAPLVLDGSGPGNGTATFAMRMPSAPNAAGMQFVWQALFIDAGAPQSVAFTDGLEMTIGR